jgi:hypothetical protein
MGSRPTLGLVLLLTLGVPQHIGAQWRGSGGSTPRPGAGEPRSTPPRPSPPRSVAPFRSSLVVRPPHMPAGRRPVLFRVPLFGLLVADPFWWTTDENVDDTPRPAPLLQTEPRPTGGLQLDVEPRRARVYLDGVYIGVVDTFSGYFHHLDAAAGLHVIEFVAPDYEPFMTEVAISPGRTITFRASLNRAPGRH